LVWAEIPYPLVIISKGVKIKRIKITINLQRKWLDARSPSSGFTNAFEILNIIREWNKDECPCHPKWQRRSLFLNKKGQRLYTRMQLELKTKREGTWKCAEKGENYYTFEWEGSIRNFHTVCLVAMYPKWK